MNINLSAPANPLGYGVVGLNVLKSLYEKDHRVAFWPIGNVECDESDAPMIHETIANQSSYDNKAPSLRIWHQHDLAQHVGKGKNCAFPIFELDKETYLFH